MGNSDPLAFSQWLWHTAAPRDEEGIPPDQLTRLDDPDLPELAKFFGAPNSLAPYIAVERKLFLEWFDILAQQRLAERELEVYELRRAGLANDHIATQLGIDDDTVRSTWHRIMHKLRPTA